ncbi:MULTISPECIES: hypothetical protein [unclassified Sphingobacterium]|nr:MULTISPECIES: hypothetical protein [unclassified Sphingobacterium]
MKNLFGTPAKGSVIVNRRLTNCTPIPVYLQESYAMFREPFFFG